MKNDNRRNALGRPLGDIPALTRLSEQREKINMEIKNAIIESVSLSSDDYGFLSAWLHLSYGGCGQGFGGYALYLPKSFTHHKIESCAGHFIFRCMEIAGVTKWSEMVGRSIRVKSEHNGVHAIGHIIKDDWFCPSEDFKNP